MQQTGDEAGRENRNLVLFLRGNGIALRPAGMSLCFGTWPRSWGLSSRARLPEPGQAVVLAVSASCWSISIAAGSRTACPGAAWSSSSMRSMKPPSPSRSSARPWIWSVWPPVIPGAKRHLDAARVAQPVVGQAGGPGDEPSGGPTSLPVRHRPEWAHRKSGSRGGLAWRHRRWSCSNRGVARQLTRCMRATRQPHGRQRRRTTIIISRRAKHRGTPCQPPPATC